MLIFNYLLDQLWDLWTMNKTKDHLLGEASPSDRCTSHNHTQCPCSNHSANQNKARLLRAINKIWIKKITWFSYKPQKETLFLPLPRRLRGTIRKKLSDDSNERTLSYEQNIQWETKNQIKTTKSNPSISN